MIDTDLILKILTADPNEPAPNGCGCDFCTRKKRHEDNWCSYCANVKMEPPKHWENLDMCDDCEWWYAWSMLWYRIGESNEKAVPA